MIVHIGVVFLAVGLTVVTAFGQRGTLALAQGQTGTFAGQSVEFVGTRVARTPSHISQQALLRIDGGAAFTPAISQLGTGTQAVGTPAIDSSLTSDVYLTINSIPGRVGPWTFGGAVQPLVMWLWIGGALIVVGSVLSRRPDDAGGRPTRCRPRWTRRLRPCHRTSTTCGPGP